MQKQAKKLQQNVARLEQQVGEAEALRATLQAQLEDPAIWSDGRRASQRQRDFEAASALLARLTAEWVAAATQLMALESPSPGPR